jgi:hypothetical protein
VVAVSLIASCEVDHSQRTDVAPSPIPRTLTTHTQNVAFVSIVRTLVMSTLLCCVFSRSRSRSKDSLTGGIP